MSSAVSTSTTSLILCIAPSFIKYLMTSTARSAMRLASSWIVMTSGITTSRTIFSRDCGNTHRLELFALALALQRGQRAFALLLVEGVVDRQLDALALLVRLDSGCARSGLAGALGATAVVFFLVDLGRAADALGSFHVRVWRVAALGYRSRAACRLHAAAAQDCTTCADARRRRRDADVPMRGARASGACVTAPRTSLTAGALRRQAVAELQRR